MPQTKLKLSELIEEEFNKNFPISWWYSIGAGKGKHKDNYKLARKEIKEFILKQFK